MSLLFKRFNDIPLETNDPRAEEFARLLPEFKLSVAKLQGHFLKYRGQPDLQIKHAKDLLDDPHQVMNDMTITEYLRRLNLLTYAPNFSKNKIFFLSDLRFYSNQGALMSKFGIKEKHLAQRMAAQM